jgi:HEAT repeat protein
MRSTTVFAALVALLALFVCAGTEAQRRPTRRPSRPQQEVQTADGATIPAPTIEDLDQIVPRLRSANPDEVRQAIDLLSVIDRREVIPPLVELLRSGPPDAITDRALEALRGLADPTSIEILSEFTRHRRAGARRRAYQALAAIQDRRVPPLLEQGLRDSDRTVRSTCALALGNIGARGSVEVLFRAFERGVVEAAVALGKLGDARSVTRFHEHLGRQPLSVMLSGYEQYLRRADIDEGTKMDIITRLGELSGRAVREFLSQYLATFSQGDRSRLRQVVQDTLRRIPIEGDSRMTAPASGAPAGGGTAAAAAGGAS